MPPRVAYFPDSFHEVNGVAHTSRNFAAYAQRHHLPFLCVRAGNRPHPVEQTGNLRTLELPRSAAAVGVEKDLAFDPLFWRHAELIEDELHRFQPDILHMTGPSELGLFAAFFARKLKLPLAASWHTNVHEYAAHRLNWLTRKLPPQLGAATQFGAQAGSLEIATRLYSRAQVLFAPNPDLCTMLASATGRPCHLMQRGVDTTLFSPAHRTRQHNAQPFLLGFVGRLSIEKNVALLPLIERELLAQGIAVRFLIIGHGALEAGLRQSMPNADFAGVLRGPDLARAYANMDLLVFPSHTDTFGNVVLEALASGVPAIVTPDGGPRYIVRDRTGACDPTHPETGVIAHPETGVIAHPETGVIAPDSDFAPAIAQLLRDPARLAAMRLAARAQALTCTWDAVFDRVYAAYSDILQTIPGPTPPPQLSPANP